MASLRNKVAIVAVGDTEVGMVPHLNSMQLHAKASKLALTEAGLRKEDIDGLMTSGSFVDDGGFHALDLAEYLQIRPRYLTSVARGGAETFKQIHHAASSIMSGMCETILIVTADNILSRLSRSGTVETFGRVGHPQYEQPFGPPIPASYALVGTAHMHRYGTTMEQMAAIAVACRKHASMNPAAQMRTPITVDDVINSKLIAWPLHILDCSLISDGGGAFIMTSAERARDFPKKPVYLLGMGEGFSHKQISQAENLTTSIGCKTAGQAAYAMAGLGPQDIDVAQLYDCFTPTVIVELEDLGFCAKGEGGPFAASGAIELGGSLPMNTHGGLLSHAHPGIPGAIFHITEAVRQLRGECGVRQVKDAKIALVHGQAGVLSAHCTMILSSEPI